MSEKPLFEIEQFVSFSDADPAGIVFFANIFNYAHKALELFKASQKSWDGWFNDPKVGWPLRHAEAEFFAPIRVGRYIKTVLYLDKQGNNSICFRCMIYQEIPQAKVADAAGDEPPLKEILCATVKTVHVQVVR